MYNSYNFDAKELKWVDARLNCELMRPDITLMSVRSGNELSVIKGTYLFFVKDKRKLPIHFQL